MGDSEIEEGEASGFFDSEIEEGEASGFFDSEIEEGEASGFWDSDLYIDIDVALSYFDDKIEELLGHHRKCFEGELSLEKLGAKFGGYGSFLPSYERSPHTMTNNRTIQNVKNDCVQVPTRDNQPMQEAARKPTVSVKEACLSGPGPKHASSCAPPLPIPRQPSVYALVEAPNSSGKVSNTEPVNQFEQKTLKVRLKVGSDHALSTQENAKIYSNLGLDMSPYPSAENRPSEGEMEGHLADSSEEYFDSPSDILRTMTSFPIPCGVMLSPLHENLVNLLEKKDALDRSRTSRVQGQERTVLWANEEVPGENKGKLGNRSLGPVELKKGDSNDLPSKFNACLKKEIDGQLSKGEHLSYDELKRPLESCKMTRVSFVSNRKDRIPEANVDGEKIKVSSHKAREVDKLTAKAASDGKVQHDKNVGHVPRDYRRKGDTSLGLLKENGDMPEGVNECRGRTMHLSRQKSLPNLRDEIKTSPVEKTSFTDKRKSRSQSLSSSVSARPSKTLKISSSVELKEGNFPSKSKGDSKLPPTPGKVKLSRRDSTRDTKHGSDESRRHLSGTSVDYKAKKEYKLQASPKELAFGNISEEPASENKNRFLSVTKSDVKVSNDATLSSVPIPINAAPVLIKENWVGCDRCEKWRLLPYGTDPDQFPKKWRCDMLYWLPGMNKCSISEEETTNALNALYQVRVTGNQIGQQSNPVATETAVTSVVNQENLTFSSAEKEPGNKEVYNSSRFHHSTPRKRLSSVLKDGETHVERKIMSDRSQFPIETKLEENSGGMRPQKAKFRRKNDVDTDTIHRADEGQNTSELFKKETEINNTKYRESSVSRDMRSAREDHTLVSVGKLNNQVEKTVDKRVRDKSDSAGKKLRFTEQKVSQIYQGNHYKNDEDRKNDYIAREEKNQNDWKKKEATKSKVEKKDSTSSKAYSKPAGNSDKNWPLDQCTANMSSRLTTVAEDTSRRDLKDGQQGMAAATSSSKISGTSKLKIIFQDVKDSTADSVCSSPSKILNRNNPGMSLSGKNGGGTYIGLSRPSGSKGGDISTFSQKPRNENSFSNTPFTYHDDELTTQTKWERVASPRGHSLTNSHVGSDYVDGYDYGTQYSIEPRARKKSQELDAHDDHFFYGILPQKSGGGSSSLIEAKLFKPASAPEHDSHDLAAASHQSGKNDGQNGLQLVRLRHSSTNGQEERNIVASNQTAEDYGRQTTNSSLKQAKNLNHSADCLKISGSGLESTEIFFQAALKLLQGASRHNPSNHMNANHREMSPAEMYGSAAKLSEYCASGFERCNSMGFAALAYKCVEVAYMQVVNSNVLTASRDRNELQVELQKVSAVESPSSSASDLDNLNNDERMGKFLIPKDAVEPQATGDLVIAARNMPNLVRLLNFAQDVNFAMEASRKSQTAFADAKIALAQTGNIDSISAIKRVLDVDFHNVEGLLQLIHNAMETLSRCS